MEPLKWLESRQREIATWLTSTTAIRSLSGELRTNAPIVSFFGQTIVSRHADVCEVLANDRAFGVTEFYAARMARTTGAFFLGMEDTPQYQREAAIARSAVRSDDARRIADIVDACTSELLDEARRRGGAFDAVSEFSRIVPLRLVRDYFGVPGPNAETMLFWMRSIFWDIFFNPDDDDAARERSTISAAGLAPYLEGLIRERRNLLSSGQGLPDDFVSRMLEQQAADPTIHDDLIRRDVGGIIVGAVEPLSKAIALVVDELLRRPRAMESARRAASADDDRSLAGHVWEALRFNPHHPLVFRHCTTDTVIAEGTSRETVVEKGNKVVLLVSAAMFDPAVFDRPDEFMPDRPSDSYLHFGRGQHHCFGARINAIVVPRAVKALLALENLAYDERGPCKIEYEGPFPDRMPLRFDVPR